LLGYAGWAAGQLEMELEENAWFHSPADHPVIFDTPPTELAKKVVEQSGIDLSRISHRVGHA
jgi:putative transcriptional regulator